MAGCIDVHTHAFPDTIASAAVASLEKTGNVKAYHNGTVDGLLSSMEIADITASVICSIATRPEQFTAILDWSNDIRTERIIPFPSVHPDDPNLEHNLELVVEHGFKGLKLHPYYQDFYLDDPGLNTLYQKVSDLGILLVVHTGYDIGYPRIQRAEPERVLKVVEQFPDLKFITTHLGGWDEWDSVRQLLIGKPIYMELSFALDFLDQIRIRDMLLSHPPEFLLFGSDSPWADQFTTLKMLRKMELPQDLMDNILWNNAARLLGL